MAGGERGLTGIGGMHAIVLAFLAEGVDVELVRAKSGGEHPEKRAATDWATFAAKYAGTMARGMLSLKKWKSVG